MIGQRLLHYEIAQKLGEGGMGVVYKARDTHLDRFVAVKVLPPEKVADASRKARFVQEAKAASALNHPNIVVVHDIASEGGVDFMVMELIAGKTLEQLIGRKGLGLNETLKYAIQIADALARAHGAGIVHRDLKPSNVMVDEHGLVKVLDFGLAKLTELLPTDEDASTQTVRAATEEGTVLGTAAYMSPEQAEGKKVDARSDIFSFGSVLYEMVTGRRAFQGDSKMSTLSAVLHQEPKPLTQDVPQELARVVEQCLRKNIARRFQHMDDVKIALEDLKQESDSGRLTGTGRAAGAEGKRLWPWITGATAIAMLAAGASWLWLRSGRSPSTRAVPSIVPLTSYAGLENSPSFSPDGAQVAFHWNGEKGDNYDIYVKIIGEEKPLRLTQDPAPDRWPKWSPDGRWIAYVKKLPAGRVGLYLTSPIGGSEKKVAEVSGFTESLPGPYHAWTPDSKHLAFIGRDSETEPCGLFLFSLEDGQRRRLTRPKGTLHGETTPEFSPDGRILAFTRVAIFGIGKLLALDLGARYSVLGEARTLVEDPGMHLGPTWTADGREIIYSTYGVQGTWFLRRVGATGGTSVVVPWGAQSAASPSVSRQGSRMAFASLKSDVNIWRAELGAGGKAVRSTEKFASSTYAEASPAFSPDAARIAFYSDRSGRTEIWTCRSDGSNPVQLTSLGWAITTNPRWSPDGRWIAFNSAATGDRDVYVISSEGGSPRRLTNDPADEAVRGWSQDGQWIYFVRNPRINSIAWKISADGSRQNLVARDAHALAESPDGRYLYYVKSSSPDYLRRASLKEGAVAGSEEVLPIVVRPKDFQVFGDGVYFIGPPTPDQTASLGFYESSTGRVTVLLKALSPFVDGLSISADRRYVLWTQRDESVSDLMLVENFR